jgi:hypothetical protein
MSIHISNELLALHEQLLRAQLNVIKQLRKAAGYDEAKPKEKGMSQVSMVYDILDSASRPMHVSAIIDAVEKKFQVRLDRESIVSALSKRVKRQDRFIKTGPNTFYLIDRDEGGGRR